jgi:hypothetical protein
MVNMAMPIALFVAGRYLRITSKESGMSTPPVNPCSTRKRIMNSKERACPQQTEKTTNRIEFTRRYFFSENAAESHEVNEITTISATRYAVGTHEISSELAARVPAMSRSEEFVTMISSTAMKHPRRTPVTHIQVFNET